MPISFVGVIAFQFLRIKNFEQSKTYRALFTIQFKIEKKNQKFHERVRKCIIRKEDNLVE
jgi:hypothetical protein